MSETILNLEEMHNETAALLEAARASENEEQLKINAEINPLISILVSDSLDNEGHQTYVELRKLASAMSIWRTTLAVSGHLSLAWLTRNR